jgi:Flp pilus assembly protein TadD
MPLTCPVCRAANDAGPTCRRCRADLALCFAVEDQRNYAVAAARSAAAAGRVSDALAHARRAAELRRGPDADQLLAVLHLLAGDFAAARALYHPA